MQALLFIFLISNLIKKTKTKTYVLSRISRHRKENMKILVNKRKTFPVREKYWEKCTFQGTIVFFFFLKNDFTL